MDDRFLYEHINRRDFIKKVSLGIFGAGLCLSGFDLVSSQLFAQLADVKAEKKGKMYYRKLGKTDLVLSEVGFNGGLLEDPAVLSYAMDLGLNFIDTAPMYGNSEELIAKVLKYRKNDLIVATKWEVNETIKETDLEKSVEESLKRLGIETIEIIQVWGARRKTQVVYEPTFNAFDKLKKAGKVKYLGITCHLNETEVTKEIINCGKYDTMMVAYNYRNHKLMNPLLEEGAKKNIGIIAQYIDAGLLDIPSPHKGTIRGALEWALTNKNISSAVVPIRDIADANELLRVPDLIRKK